MKFSSDHSSLVSSPYLFFWYIYTLSRFHEEVLSNLTMLVVSITSKSMPDHDLTIHIDKQTCELYSYLELPIICIIMIIQKWVRYPSAVINVQNWYSSSHLSLLFSTYYVLLGRQTSVLGLYYRRKFYLFSSKVNYWMSAQS
jgi:hypothetical protein